MKISIIKNKYFRQLRQLIEFIENTYEYRCSAFYRLHPFTDYSIKSVKKKPKRIISIQEFSKIYESCSSDEEKILLVTLFLFGLREAEICGLTVDEFDFDSGSLTIFKQVTRKLKKKDPGKKYTTLNPKGNKSRVYPIPPIYSKMLQSYISKYKLKDNSYIFHNSGEPRSEHWIECRVKQFGKVIDFPEMNPHLFRKCCISHLKSEGNSLETIAQMVGHNSVQVTKDYYVFDTPEEIEAMRNFEENLLGSTIKNFM